LQVVAETISVTVGVVGVLGSIGVGIATVGTSVTTVTYAYGSAASLGFDGILALYGTYSTQIP
jgi:hypothetical protein